MYTIMGATGHIGYPLARKILSAGKQVRILASNRKKSKTLTAMGAELRTGNFMDQSYMRNAFAGVRIAYVFIPENWPAAKLFEYQKKQIDIITNSIAAGSVKFVVFLSSLGANLSSNGGISGFQYMEQQLNALKDIHVLHLRPAFFMENLIPQIPIIKQYGIMAAPVRGDLPINMIATIDIANYAARRLLILDFRDKQVQHLLGPDDLTMNQVVSIIGHAIDESDLTFHQLPEETFVKAIIRAGVSKDAAFKLDYYFKLMKRDVLIQEIRRDKESTTLTTLQQFASAILAPLFSP